MTTPPPSPCPAANPWPTCSVGAWPLLAPLLERPPEESDDEGATVLVSHNFVVKVLICAALDFDLNHWRRFETDLTGRTILERGRGQTVLRTLNDFSHLSAALRV